MELTTTPAGEIATWRQGTGEPALLIHGGPGLSDAIVAMTAPKATLA